MVKEVENGVIARGEGGGRKVRIVSARLPPLTVRKRQFSAVFY